MTNSQLILLLSAAPGVGEKTLGTVLHRNAVLRRTPREMLSLNVDRLVEEYRFRRRTAQYLAELSSKAISAAEGAEREMRRAGIEILTTLDASYPARLMDAMDDPPQALYAYGRLDMLNTPLFAVANSNDASNEALAAGDRAAEAAIASGWWPVTGHNRVPYQRPALVARRTGGRICYVLDRGIFEAFGGDLSRELFPAARIWSPAYDPWRDLSLSPFPLRAHCLAVHNQRRDSILFALARAIFVGEVRPLGHMEHACRDALKRECPVYLVGPPRNEDQCLLDSGAKRIEPKDISSILM